MEREATVLLVITLTLVLIGVLMVYSTASVDKRLTGLPLMQLAYVILGLTVMFFLAQFDYHSMRAPWFYAPIVIVSALLLVLVLNVGEEIGGARRWLVVYPTKFKFQPSELAKFAVILLLAVKLTENQSQMRSVVRGFLPAMLIAAVFAGLIFRENDLGMPVVIMMVAVLMVFAAGVPWVYLAGCALPGAAAVVAACWTSDERWSRIQAWLHPWDYAKTEGFHLIQSQIAFSRGSVWGQGAGASEQKLYCLPAAHTDFIFSVWAEEMGLVGALLLVGLYAVLLVVGLRIAAHARDLFGTLLATGITCLVTFQAAFVMGVTTGLLPTKGLPLPFISSGGTSLIVFLALMGILISIGRQAYDSDKEGLALSRG